MDTKIIFPKNMKLELTKGIHVGLFTQLICFQLGVITQVICFHISIEKTFIKSMNILQKYCSSLHMSMDMLNIMLILHLF